MVFPSKLKVTVLRQDGKEKENFLLSTDRHMQLCHRFDNLKNEIVARYPELVQYEEIKFVYIDEEGDEITILNHADYYDYMESCAIPTQRRRIYVRGVNKIQPVVATAPAPAEESPMEQDAAPRQQESAPAAAAAPAVDESPVDANQQPVHTNIICDVCDETIRGHRYKCLQCFNYDLCMRCEAKFRHKDHMMVRIPKPEMQQRGPFRLFEKLRSFAADIGAAAGQQQQQTATANDCRGEDDYEGSKRSKRHHRRHSKERSDSKERREEKERKERKHRRERSAKSAEERRSCSRRYGGAHGFNFSQLINQVIDPANIQSAFLFSDAAAAAAAAIAESAQEAAQQAAEQAVRVTMAHCPQFATSVLTNSTAASTSATATTSASAAEPTAAPAPGASAGSTSPNVDPQTAAPEEPKQVDVLDFSWLTPTPESIQKINQTFSRILDPLGMNIEIRSNGNSPKPAAQTQTPTEEKKDKTTETANTPTTSTPSQTTPTSGVPAAGTSSKATEMDPLVVELGKQLETALLTDPELERKLGQKLEAVLLGSDDEDDDSTDSSVSLLTDNDEAAETSGKPEKKWTLIDIPNDDADEDADATTGEQTKKSTETAEKVELAVEAAAAASSTSSAKTPATPAASATYPEPDSASSANSNGRNSKPIDYEQLGKALKQHLEAEKQQAASATTSSNNASAPPTPAAAPKETTPPPPPKVVASAPVAQQTPAPAASVSHSRRPHVNRAVDAMMVMGFSNEGGWLTQLLESVDGDIPRALDLLTPQRMNP
uniref:Putative ia-2like protein n=1 Tax=Psorophora albipes TaxID=869069 RepID=T1DHZ7_9DIPT